MNDEQFQMEDHLDAAVGNILQAVVSPPDLRDRLRPPQTRIVKSNGSDYKTYTIRANGKAVIRMGGATYRVLQGLTSAAATYFVTDEKGKRPSSYWPAARNRLASTIDAYASPLTTPVVPLIAVSPRQVTPATAFAQYAYRFIICHELAHIALEHEFGADAATEVSSQRASQKEELDADSFALQLQIGSLPQPEMIVTAVSAPVYFVFLLRAFDDFRLSLLSGLVDYRSWKIEYSHPPYLHRVFNLMGAATELVNETAGEGLGQVQQALEDVVQRVWSTATTTRDKVATEAATLLTTPEPAASPKLSKLLARSPIGVLQALDADRAWLDPTWPLHKVVPSELTTFLKLSPAARARQLA